MKIDPTVQEFLNRMNIDEKWLHTESQLLIQYLSVERKMSPQQSLILFDWAQKCLNDAFADARKDLGKK